MFEIKEISIHSISICNRFNAEDTLSTAKCLATNPNVMRVEVYTYNDNGELSLQYIFNNKENYPKEIVEILKSNKTDEEIARLLNKAGYYYPTYGFDTIQNGMYYEFSDEPGCNNYIYKSEALLAKDYECNSDFIYHNEIKSLDIPVLKQLYLDECLNNCKDFIKDVLVDKSNNHYEFAKKLYNIYAKL